MYKLAIIGNSSGQLKLYQKAKDMGCYTIGFSWNKGVVSDNLISKFYKISIIEKDKIVDICRQENIDGVVSNGSDLTAQVAAYISDKLNLNGNSYEDIIKSENKFYVRNLTNSVLGLTPVKSKLVKSEQDMFYPCVVKPCIGSSKKGIGFANDMESGAKAFQYAKQQNKEVFIEEFISGQEFSIESISFNGKHKVIQITEKQSSGKPHFIEMGHIQPANIPVNIRQKIYKIIPDVLDKIKFKNGATHTEIKINMESENIYLIEVNLRGGGDEISNTLINLSTDFDYIAAMIKVALGIFDFPKDVKNKDNVGICFLCKQTEEYFKDIIKKQEVIEKHIVSDDVKESTTNYDRQGYVIYKFKQRGCK